MSADLEKICRMKIEILFARQLTSIVSSDGNLEDILQLLGSYTKANATLIPAKADGILIEPRLFSDLQTIQLDDTLLLYRDGKPFTEEDKNLAEICLPLLMLFQKITINEEKNKQKHESKLVKSVLNTLSYTELEVVLRIFNTLGGNEGTLIAGKVADGLRVTRSVVVSALRKLESARIIEARSLGAKGTYIRVLNPLWLSELQKFK